MKRDLVLKRKYKTSQVFTLNTQDLNSQLNKKDQKKTEHKLAHSAYLLGIYLKISVPVDKSY